MAVIIKYSKSFYQAKITELESYHQELGTHLDNMNKLKDRMFQFWDDEAARKTSKILTKQIYDIQVAMDRTKEITAIYKSAVDKFGGIQAANEEILQSALSLLNGSGT